MRLEPEINGARNNGIIWGRAGGKHSINIFKIEGGMHSKLKCSRMSDKFRYE